MLNQTFVSMTLPMPCEHKKVSKPFDIRGIQVCSGSTVNSYVPKYTQQEIFLTHFINYDL